MAQFAVAEADLSGPVEHETDRARFLGRGNSVDCADALSGRRPLANSSGTVLDPVFALRYKLRLYPGRAAQLVFWTIAASIVSTSASIA